MNHKGPIIEFKWSMVIRYWFLYFPLDPPTVHSLSQQDIVEGRGVNVTCTARLGNPNSTTFYWTKVGDSGFRHNGPTLQLTNVHRNSSGIYRCTAENNYSIEEKGTHNQSMVVNVLCENLTSYEFLHIVWCMINID